MESTRIDRNGTRKSRGILIVDKYINQFFLIKSQFYASQRSKLIQERRFDYEDVKEHKGIV